MLLDSLLDDESVYSADHEDHDTSTLVGRKTHISYECYPDLLLGNLFDDESDYSVDHEDDDCAVDLILQLMHSMAMSKGSK